MEKKPEFLKLRCGKRTVLVEVVRPGVGWRVEAGGVRWGAFKPGNVMQTELVFFKPGNVVCKMKMNLHYGELEPE